MRVRRHDDEIVLSAQDDAPAAAVHTPHVFDRFYRTETSRSRSDRGRPWGWLSSGTWSKPTVAAPTCREGGAGSVFTITLPVRPLVTTG